MPSSGPGSDGPSAGLGAGPADQQMVELARLRLPDQHAELLDGHLQPDDLFELEQDDLDGILL